MNSGIAKYMSKAFKQASGHFIVWTYFTIFDQYIRDFPNILK